MITIAISVLTTLLIIGHVGGIGPWLLWTTLVILWLLFAVGRALVGLSNLK